MAVDRSAIDHEPLILTRRPGGGFVLQSGSGQTTRVEREGEGWRAIGETRTAVRSLRRPDDEARGFVAAEVLDSGAAEVELGRTLPAADGDTGPRCLLLSDGRLFRIVAGRPRDGGFALLSWETPGAYLVARPIDDGWRLTPSEACGCIPDIGVLTLLLAAEVLDAEEPLEAGTKGR